MRTEVPRSLTCWKEIAHYLGKGVRTVQRWERELGLPIHRPSSRSTGIVLALPAELDAWMTAPKVADGENRETAWLLGRIEKLEAENEILRRALNTLLARRPFHAGPSHEDVPLEFLWEQSAQLLMNNLSERHRHNQLRERSRQILSLRHSLPPPRQNFQR